MIPQLACPRCHGSLEPTDQDERGAEIKCPVCGPVGRVADGVWDFVGGRDYAESFGRQWSDFRHVQFDSQNGTTISHDQFRRVTGWSADDLAGQQVLDGGCGAGRYSEVALELGAVLTALDLSEAAYTASANLSKHEGLTVVRGDLLSPPLRRGWFDKAFSIGVLQHTPDPLEAARQLLRLVKPGGELAVWMYERRPYSPLLPKYLMRGVTRRLPEDAVRRFSDKLVTAVTPVARAAAAVRQPTLRRVVRASLPIASYWGVLPLTPEQQVEWSRLDTRDWLTPVYDQPKTFEELRAALIGAGAASIRRLAVPGLAVVATAGATG